MILKRQTDKKTLIDELDQTNQELMDLLSGVRKGEELDSGITKKLIARQKKLMKKIDKDPQLKKIIEDRKKATHGS